MVWLRFLPCNLQGKLFALEEKVKDRSNGSFDDDIGFQQHMDSVQQTLEAYNNALLQQSRLSQLGSPNPVSIRELRRWAVDVFGENSQPVLRFLEESKEDLVTLDRSENSKTGVYKLLERLSWRFLARLYATSSRFKVKSTDGLKPIAGGRRIQFPNGGWLHLYDDNKIRMMLRALVTLVSSVVLLIPVVVLSIVNDKRQAVFGVAVCTAVMAVILAAGTDCREHEIIIAASAYAAVLIVFVSN